MLGNPGLVRAKKAIGWTLVAAAVLCVFLLIQVLLTPASPTCRTSDPAAGCPDYGLGPTRALRLEIQIALSAVGLALGIAGICLLVLGKPKDLE
jgi:hypothetical protein